MKLFGDQSGKKDLQAPLAKALSPAFSRLSDETCPLRRPGALVCRFEVHVRKESASETN